MTVTVTDWPALPPAPPQTKLNVLVVVKGPTASLSAVALLPDHAPDAVHEVALAEFQIKVVESPAVTDEGLAVSDTVGGGGGGCPFTVTVTDRVVLLPAPLQDRLNVLVIVSGPTVWLSDRALAPDQAPAASQDVAFVTDQVRLEDPLMATEDGLAVKDMTGAGAGLPPPLRFPLSSSSPLAEHPANNMAPARTRSIRPRPNNRSGLLLPGKTSLSIDFPFAPLFPRCG